MLSLKLSKYLDNLKIKPLHFIFLSLPLFLVLFSGFTSRIIYDRYIFNEISRIELLDISSFDKLKNLATNVKKEYIKTNQIVYTLNIKYSGKESLAYPSLPPLDRVVPQNIDNKYQHNTFENIKLQAVYMSEKSKFAIINGRIYREGQGDENIKLVIIQPKKVYVENNRKERIWISLD